MQYSKVYIPAWRHQSHPQTLLNCFVFLNFGLAGASAVQIGAKTRTRWPLNKKPKTSLICISVCQTEYTVATMEIHFYKIIVQ